MLIDILRGSKSEKITRFQLDQLSTYGICEERKERLHTIIDYLLQSEYIIKTNDKFPVVKLGERAKDALKEDLIQMKLPKERVRIESKSKTKLDERPVDRKLFEALRSIRAEIAKEQNVPAFVIFHDSTLRNMCIKAPKNKYELLEVSGVGKIKAERYGDRFLKAITEFL